MPEPGIGISPRGATRSAPIQEVADALAIGVYNLAHCFMPQRIVIGGGMSRAGELLVASVRARLDRCSATCPASGAAVALAQRGDDAGLLGAYALWRA